METSFPSAADLRVLSPFLRACYGTDTAASVLLLAAGGALALAPFTQAASNGLTGALLAISILAGLTEKYFALRVKFDLELFDRLAAGLLDMEQLDSALTRLFGTETKDSRSVASRIQGTVALARRQLTTFAVQGVSLALTGIMLLR